MDDVQGWVGLMQQFLDWSIIVSTILEVLDDRAASFRVAAEDYWHLPFVEFLDQGAP